MQTPRLKRYLGAFHKSGTALFNSILHEATKQNVLTPWLLNENPEPPSWDVAFDYHSDKLYPIIAASPVDEVRCVICIRDPRDIVVSGAYYHQHSKEAWLHDPRPRDGGLTYQQVINSLPDMQARFRFELNECALWTIVKMRKIPFDAPNVTITRLETLVDETTRRAEYARIFEFLQFDPETRAALERIAEEKSIDTSKTATGTSPNQTKHVRSGKSEQYTTEFDAETLRLFYERHGDIVKLLGYPE